MPYIINTLEEPVSTQAHGKWFSWKAKEIKVFHNKALSDFLSQMRGEEGLMEVPEDLYELGVTRGKDNKEYLSRLNEIIKSGIEKFVAKQNSIVHNLEISLRGDYERSGRKGNFLFEASKGELEAYKKLKKYREFEAAEKLNVADEIQKIRGELYGDAARPNPIEGAEPVQPLNRK